MKYLYALLLCVVGLADLSAQTKMWTSYLIQSGSPAPVTLGNATIQLPPANAPAVWAGGVSSITSSSYTLAG